MKIFMLSNLIIIILREAWLAIITTELIQVQTILIKIKDQVRIHL
jgi:hypothetical protein